LIIVSLSGVRRKFSWGNFHSVAYGGHLYLGYALCDGYAPLFDAIFMFPNQRFGEVC